MHGLSFEEDTREGRKQAERAEIEERRERLEKELLSIGNMREIGSQHNAQLCDWRDTLLVSGGLARPV